jgi:hypothetical protein
MQAGNEEVATLVAQLQRFNRRKSPTLARSWSGPRNRIRRKQAYGEQQRLPSAADWSNPAAAVNLNGGCLPIGESIIRGAIVIPSTRRGESHGNDSCRFRLDYGPDLINDVANQYINAINSGFGLIRGDVTRLLNVLIILSIMWSATLWALSDDHVIVQFARKIVYIGMFAWIIQNWQMLTDKLARSFMDLGLKAGGFDEARLTTPQQPGNIAYLGYTTAQPLMDQITAHRAGRILQKLPGNRVPGFRHRRDRRGVLCHHDSSGDGAGDVQVRQSGRFRARAVCVLSKTAFIAERPLGWVVGSGVRLMVLTLVLGSATTSFKN